MSHCGCVTLEEIENRVLNGPQERLRTIQDGPSSEAVSNEAASRSSRRMRAPELQTQARAASTPAESVGCPDR